MEKTNKLIAEFMGMTHHRYIYHLSNNDKSMMVKETPQGNEVIPIDSLQYDSSWDWLMPVIEKIESLGYTFEKNYQRVDKDWQSLIVKGNDILYQEFNEDSLQCSHYVVVEFIKEYNNESKQ
tara:strand:- start:95 stop:460 length:366 start_codon:yes stop_codon:yes gene_type:complete